MVSIINYIGELNVYKDMTRFTGFCTDLSKEKKIGQCSYSGNTTQELNYNIKEDILSNPSFISDSIPFIFLLVSKCCRKYSIT